VKGYCKSGKYPESPLPWNSLSKTVLGPLPSKPRHKDRLGDIDAGYWLPLGNHGGSSVRVLAERRLGLPCRLPAPRSCNTQRCNTHETAYGTPAGRGPHARARDGGRGNWANAGKSDCHETRRAFGG